MILNKIKKVKKDIFLFLPVIVLFLLLNIFFLWITKIETKRDLLSIRFMLEKKIFFLLDLFRTGAIDDFIDFDKDIISFGVYDSNGNKIYGYKNPPETIAIFYGKNFEDFFEKKRGYITLIRFLGPPPFMMPPDMMHHKMFDERMNKIVYLKIRSKERRLAWIFFAFLETIFFALFLSFFYLYRVNSIYRRKLEEQKELVKIGEMSRTLAHEIKNPLTSIQLQTGYLKKILPHDYKELSNIEEEINRIKKLTDRIRDFVTDPIGNREFIDLFEFCKKISNSFEHEIKIFKEADSESVVFFDIDRLRIIVENLITNSIESLNEVESFEPIEISIKSEVSGIFLTVKDTGVGFYEKDLGKVFDPFFTTKVRGSGLGLSMVKRFMEANNGEVFISNRDDKKGAVVTLKFKR